MTLLQLLAWVCDGEGMAAVRGELAVKNMTSQRGSASQRTLISEQRSHELPLPVSITCSPGQYQFDCQRAPAGTFLYSRRLLIRRLSPTCSLHKNLPHFASLLKVTVKSPLAVTWCDNDHTHFQHTHTHC